MVRVRTDIGRSLALLAMLAASVSLCAQQGGETIRHHRIAVEDPEAADLAQAESAIEKKDYASAKELLNKVVAAEPQNYEAWFDLGFVNNALGKPDDAITAYRQAVKAKPDIFESNLNLGLMLARAGQPDAEESLQAATKLTPTTHVNESKEQAWLALGHVQEKSKPEDAVQSFQQAATLQPNDLEPYLSAGPILERLNKIPEAEQAYKHALEIDPQSADAAVGLANLYMRSHRFADAESALRKLLTLHPNDANAHLELGRILVAENHPDEGLAEMQIAEKAAPGDLTVEREIADLLLAQKKYPEAEVQYRQLLTVHANDAELHASLGKALLFEKKFPEAQQELLTAVRIKPDMGEVYGDIAMVADENKNYALTIKALDVRAKLLPELPMTYFLRATAYDHLRDVKNAAENYHRFLEVADGKFPDQEWQARHRLIALEPKK